MIRLRPKRIYVGVILFLSALLVYIWYPLSHRNILVVLVDYSVGIRSSYGLGSQSSVSLVGLFLTILVPLFLIGILTAGVYVLVSGFASQAGALFLLLIWFLLYGLFIGMLWVSGDQLIIGAWDLRYWPFKSYPILVSTFYGISMYIVLNPTSIADIIALAVGLSASAILQAIGSMLGTHPTDIPYYSLAFGFVIPLVSLSGIAGIAVVVNLASNIYRDFACRDYEGLGREI